MEMLGHNGLALGLLFLTPLIELGACDNEVFAHLIIGNTYGYTLQDFLNDIGNASAAGIDGFALNISNDTYTNSSLTNAYAAAEQFGNFSLFLSFDYAAHAWTIDEVVGTIDSYSSSSAQFNYETKPFVSTFEGPDYASNWSTIKDQTGCFFIPDYSSQGASGAASEPNVDGLLSWDAWPYYQNDTPSSDQEYIDALAGKPYMMPVSPWFYTNIPGSKNWLWHTDELWPLRWQQVYDYKPTFIELLTWNDWGESHYLGPITSIESDIPTAAQWYVDYMPHSAWLNDLPYYIAKYKAGGAEPAAGTYTPHITFWYRLNPKASCSDDGTTCNSAPNNQATFPATDCTEDGIFFEVFTDSTATVSVSVGGTTLEPQTAIAAGLFYGAAAYGSDLGAVIVSASMSDGTTLGPVTGPNITTDCIDGNVKWNAWVGGS